MKDLHTSMLPIGSIIMWGLPLEQKPKNFVLCNGDEHIINGVKQRVPDLLGRFALGVGNGYGFKAMAGEYEVQLDEKHMPRHTHTGKTDNGGGEHEHTMGYKWSEKIENSSNYSRDYYVQNHPYANNPQVYKEINKIDKGAHVHYFTTDATGGNVLTGKADKHNNMPPYFSLYYLIKIAN